MSDTEGLLDAIVARRLGEIWNGLPERTTDLLEQVAYWAGTGLFVIIVVLLCLEVFLGPRLQQEYLERSIER